MTELTTAEAIRTRDSSWHETVEGQPAGYIQSTALKELWFHTGTRCNLGCWFCLEGSGPKAGRIDFISPHEAATYINEALNLGVEQFSFTGGEPFVNPDMVKILDHALDYRPCLVLTNGTKPLRKKLDDIGRLRRKPNALKFRISLDFPDPRRHDESRGEGSFSEALQSLGDLHKAGFKVSIARHRSANEDVAEVDARFQPYFKQAGLPTDTTIVSFPELHKPGEHVEVPQITENCMTTYKNEQSRSEFMCAYSRMIVKIKGRIGVYACTLVDDDPDYDLGATIAESLNVRVALKHHRCYSCFAQGATCSEM